MGLLGLAEPGLEGEEVCRPGLLWMCHLRPVLAEEMAGQPEVRPEEQLAGYRVLPGD